MPPKFDRSLIPPEPDFRFERELWDAGLLWVAGIDEAGRGALAGPVAAGAIIFSPEADLERNLHGVRDSKQMSPEKRRQWAACLPGLAAAWAVGFASAEEIDILGIAPATRLAVSRALEQLRLEPQHLLVDYLRLPECSLPQTPLVKGDQRSLSIAAASILAKTSRDELLAQMDSENPGYGLRINKGYGTACHRQAIRRLGYSPVHRRSFNIRN
jgi:ribonuclease HII